MINKAQKIDKDLMKQLNQKLILKIFKEHVHISRSELAKITGLTLPGVSDIISELEKYKLIINIGESPIKRGRFPTLYKINENSFKIVGISIRSESIRIGLYNLLGECLYFHEKYPVEHTTPENTLQIVTQLFSDLLSETNIDKEEISGIGLGVHGIVDAINGISIYPPHLKWRNIPIKNMLEETLGLPVLIDNDCNCLALAEYWFGQGYNSNSFITLNIDYGIGASIMINGKLFRGNDFGAGQIGHTIVKDNGSLCSCGNYGCLETTSSELSILKNIKTKIKKGFPSQISTLESNPELITLEQLYLAAKQDDQLAVSILDSAARYLGIGISTLINIFNPERVILTGGILRGNDIILTPLLYSIEQHALKTNTERLIVKQSQLGRHADVLGAASLWINELLEGNISIANIIYNKQAPTNIHR